MFLIDICSDSTTLIYECIDTRGEDINVKERVEVDINEIDMMYISILLIYTIHLS